MSFNIISCEWVSYEPHYREGTTYYFVKAPSPNEALELVESQTSKLYPDMDFKCDVVLVIPENEIKKMLETSYSIRELLSIEKY